MCVLAGPPRALIGAHSRRVRLPLLTLTSLGSGAAAGLLSCDVAATVAAAAAAAAAAAWALDGVAALEAEGGGAGVRRCCAKTYSVSLTSAVPPDSRGIGFCRKWSSMS